MLRALMNAALDEVRESHKVKPIEATFRKRSMRGCFRESGLTEGIRMRRILDFIDLIRDVRRLLLAPAYLIGDRMLMSRFLVLTK